MKTAWEINRQQVLANYSLRNIVDVILHPSVVVPLYLLNRIKELLLVDG